MDQILKFNCAAWKAQFGATGGTYDRCSSPGSNVHTGGSVDKYKRAVYIGQVDFTTGPIVPWLKLVPSPCWCDKFPGRKNGSRQYIPHQVSCKIFRSSRLMPLLLLLLLPMGVWVEKVVIQ